MGTLVGTRLIMRMKQQQTAEMDTPHCHGYRRNKSNNMGNPSNEPVMVNMSDNFEEG